MHQGSREFPKAAQFMRKIGPFTLGMPGSAAAVSRSRRRVFLNQNNGDMASRPLHRLLCTLPGIGSRSRL